MLKYRPDIRGWQTTKVKFFLQWRMTRGEEYGQQEDEDPNVVLGFGRLTGRCVRVQTHNCEHAEKWRTTAEKTAEKTINRMGWRECSIGSTMSSSLHSSTSLLERFQPKSKHLYCISPEFVCVCLFNCIHNSLKTAHLTLEGFQQPKFTNIKTYV